MRELGRITRLSELPKDAELKALVTKAAARNASASARAASPAGSEEERHRQA
jgi:hypothetical protein